MELKVKIEIPINQRILMGISASSPFYCFMIIYIKCIVGIYFNVPYNNVRPGTYTLETILMIDIT